MSAVGLALSKTCSLTDFPECLSVAEWQQCLAERAWALWQAEHHILTRESSLVVNYLDGVSFIAPGPEAIYRYRPQGDLAVEHTVPAVYGLCVLDRIEAPVKFLSRARHILRPQGLLFLTFTFWDAEGPDVAKGSAQRMRIYDRSSWTKLVSEARRLGLLGFGGHDWTYHGNTMDDHTLASLVLTKR